MAKGNKKHKAELKVTNELLSQLILRAENLTGNKGYYSPLKLEEMALDACREIISDLLIEKANLEYELHSLGTDKKEASIKIERVNAYISRAENAKKQHILKIKKILGKQIGDEDELALAVARIEQKPTVSVLIKSN
ncbi:MAG: hypothetical protein KKB81_01775 [Candidatus Margulisbacteria bacterium]|nr:hypothetical protein [Candidatus Margulisiibacteriota bacterium]MBU1021645.1 hypothetical protein [Candidatus Margulisiibacteriota bacterium]MBU1728795.1 hypothetical protein [Candidatus Margulisiibacteriota bacterium]MBU1955761.1 hypothetical protein [Candidatus Margulisiibacteriota bacterium]